MTATEPSAPSMDVEEPLPTGSPVMTRGRLVMVVDNTIDGDSRVQKSAMAAAAAGWETTLIGRSPDGVLQTYDLAGATVMRIPVPFTLHSRRRRAPGRGLRWPLAYRDTATATWRAARLEALRNDVRVYRAHSSLGPTTSAMNPAALFAIRGRLLVGRIWHRTRQHEMRRAIRFYARPDERAVAQLKARLWGAVAGERAWRHLEPMLRDYELAFAPHIELLKPDVIHSHDFRMVGLAVRVATRLKTRGIGTKVVHDVHEFLPGVSGKSQKWMIANEAYEREYIRRADAVVTVSDLLAQMLVERHHLPVKPTVVLNAPARTRLPAKPDAGPAPSLRADCGLAEGVPLLVYGGSAAVQRGLLTAVEALPLIPEAHLAFVVTRNVFVAALENLARDLGVGDRVHVLPYVDQDLVSTYYGSADVGLIPIRHFPNHEIALITKYFEYTHAGLPIVTSDVETMAAETREMGNGEVFTADDHVDLARAVNAVLADPTKYRAAYTEELLNLWSWESQTEILTGVWEKVATTKAAREQGAKKP